MATTTPLREAVGLFQDAESLRSAADTLMLNGFDRADLSILASESAVEGKLHRAYKASDLEDNADVPTIAYFAGDSLTELKAVIVSGLFFVGGAAAAGATIGNGGTIGSAVLYALLFGCLAGAFGLILIWWLTRHHDDYLAAQIKHGGLLLWVHTIDREHEERACRILKENSAGDVHVHDVRHRDWARRKQRGKVVYGFLEFLAGVKPPVRG